MGGIKNLDNKAKTDIEIKNDMVNAIREGKDEEFINAQIALSKNIEARILKEAKSAINEDINDSQVMIKRGLNPLTTEEKEYYNEVITTGGFAGAEKLVPATIFERVFEELEAEHPLLSEIDFVNTNGVVEWVFRDGDVTPAWWGKLCDDIKKKLESAFTVEQTGLFLLSAYVPVCKSMLDLGPVWLDKFVRTILAESMAMALEEAIITGDGDDKPIGMDRDLKGSVVEGVYPKKTTVALTSFKPGDLGKEIMAPLTREGKRRVDNVLIIVNPLDYWEKIFAETTFLTADKTYVYGVLPIPAKIVQSVAVEKGTMIAGIAKDYFMGVGSGLKIDYSDSYKFLERERTYIAEQYANGRPVKNDAFKLYDISNLAVEVPEA